MEGCHAGTPRLIRKQVCDLAGGIRCEDEQAQAAGLINLTGRELDLEKAIRCVVRILAEDVGQRAPFLPGAVLPRLHLASTHGTVGILPVDGVLRVMGLRRRGAGAPAGSGPCTAGIDVVGVERSLGSCQGPRRCPASYGCRSSPGGSRSDRDLRRHRLTRSRVGTIPCQRLPTRYVAPSCRG